MTYYVAVEVNPQKGSLCSCFWGFGSSAGAPVSSSADVVLAPALYPQGYSPAWAGISLAFSYFRFERDWRPSWACLDVSDRKGRNRCLPLVNITCRERRERRQRLIHGGGDGGDLDNDELGDNDDDSATATQRLAMVIASLFMAIDAFQG
ncbi:hypothetical protein N7493_010069 [Penicillium malachiteum]|uniref:Uncharacterized protein n=1 Tax=Penicillium malachiteum TaxID=1324776 RepID=A0AAD6MSC0_9EURO|nr:hypothetical protein N7493_010069 [Penicillium malachiteum]